MPSALDAFVDAEPVPLDSGSTRPVATTYTLDELQAHRFPPPRPILMRGDTPILCAGHLGELFAERGIGKTWLLQSLGLVAATAGSVLGFSAPQACRVLYIDGEMSASDLQERF